MEHWFVSDHHLAHFNILRYGERPFANLAEMHDMLVQYHNELVKPNHHVSFLGDVTIKRGGRLDKEWFSAEIKRYNGHKRLYLGNHDHWPTAFYLNFFEKVYATWRCEEGFICSHFPLHPRSLTSATANVHGHIHQTPAYESVMFKGDEFGEGAGENRRKREKRIVPYINVSVEAINYRPINKDEILAIIRRANEQK
jgi:calcineurin-like phosphoesterase family protein